MDVRRVSTTVSDTVFRFVFASWIFSHKIIFGSSCMLS